MLAAGNEISSGRGATINSQWVHWDFLRAVSFLVLFLYNFKSNRYFDYIYVFDTKQEMANLSRRSPLKHRASFASTASPGWTLATREVKIDEYQQGHRAKMV